MRRRLVILTIALSALAAVVAVDVDTADYPVMNDVIEAFTKGRIDGGTVHVGSPGEPIALNGPFSPDPIDLADVPGLDPSQVDVARLGGSIGFTAQPGPFPAFEVDGLHVTFPGAVDNGSNPMLVMEAWNGNMPFPQNYGPPFRPGGAPSPGEFIGAVLGQDPAPIQEGFDAGGSFDVGGVMIVPGELSLPDMLDRPLTVRGFHLGGDPLGDPNSLVEIFALDQIEGAPQWNSNPCCPGDTFEGGSQAIVSPVVGGVPMPAQRRVNQGSSFRNEPTGTVTLFMDNVVLQVTPYNEVMGVTMTRFGVFVTDSSQPYQAENSVHSSLPDFPGFNPTGAHTFFFENPYINHDMVPIGFNFGQSDTGSPGWMGNWGIAINPEQANGDETFLTHALQLDSLQLSAGRCTYGSSERSYECELEGSGESYSETYRFSSGEPGTYEYDSGTPATYPLMVESGSDELFLGQLETLYGERQIPEEPTSSSSSSSSTLAATSGSTAPEVIDAGASEGKSIDGGSSSPLIWIFILLILAIIAAFVWWMFFGKPKDDPCKEKYDAWQKAKAACDEATKTAKQKRTDADKAETKREDAEKAREDHCKAYPPACGPQSSATDVDSGRTVTRDDLHVQRQWARSAWTAFGAGTQTAAETEAQWKSPPTEKFRNDALKELNDAKTKTPNLDKAINDAKTAEANANAAADQADKDAKKACDDAAAAKKAYDDCVKTRDGDVAAADNAAAAAAGAAVGGVGGAVVAGAGGAAKVAGGKDCSAEQQAYDAAKKACDEAEEASNAAAKKAAEAEKALEDLCEEYPPLCHDGDWAEEAGKPETRVTTRDLFVRDLWAEHAWSDYETGDISAQELSDRWGQDPTEDFARDQLRKLEDAKPLHAARTQAVKDTKAKADETRKAADTACAKVDPAKRALDTCLTAAGG